LDKHPTKPTITTQGVLHVKGKADTTVQAKATVESQVGVAMIAFCVCDNNVEAHFCIDSAFYILYTDPLAEAVQKAQDDLYARVNEIV
jgi:hypothetical protein